MLTAKSTISWLPLVALLIVPALILGRAHRDLLSEPPIAALAHAAVIPNVQAELVAGAQPFQETGRERDGLFYVTADVNGKPLRFLIDTGASVVVLTARDAQAVGMTITDDHFKGNVQTVGGRAEMAWTTINSMRIAGRDVRNLRAAVVRNGLGVSLLGQNALSQMGSVTITGDKLSLR